MNEGDAGDVATQGAAILAAAFREEHAVVVPGSAALAPNPDDQVGFDIGLARVPLRDTAWGVHLTGAVDFLNLNVHLGSQNDDGSQGENIGATATAVGAELTAEYGGFSLTVGVSASAGASVSSGEGRDLDHDGKQERCFKASFGVWTVGECDEF